ncbi:MAG: FecR domain-containing protein [Nitrospinota bacterium]|nr:FecR domain-containing protein [Nitrospinota bacterium]
MKSKEHSIPARLFGVIFLVFAFFTASSTHAAPIGAKAVYVEGRVTVIHADKKEEPVKLGDSLAEGDTITTLSNGILEVEYDNGDLTRIDRNTTMVIKSLHRDSSGSSFSIFGLLAGRIKSAVSKLMTSESKFEYHTKSAVAGVAGTPPFVVEAKGNVTNVDLLGKKGDPGRVYVQGTDPSRQIVYLSALQRTVARFGQPILAPFEIKPDRLRRLQIQMKFKTRDVVQGQARLGSKSTTTREDNGTGMVVENISATISTFIPPSPSAGASASSRNASTNSKQGNIGSDTGEGVEADQPPPFATGNVSLIFE